jgi:hypothetical protein
VIRHLVLFRFPPAARADTEAALAAMLRGLPDRIPQIRGWQHGPNVTPDGDAWDYALSATFDSRDDLFAYFEHPDHLAGLAALAGRLELKFVDIEN